MVKRFKKLKVRPHIDTSVPYIQSGRPGILPPLGVDFETALGALLRTPPPQKAAATDKARAQKPRAKRKRR